MHGMNDQVDMRRFGALRKVMIATWITFGMGYLAILGIPPFAGFFSKDKIIEAAFDRGLAIGFITVLGAGITAFYMSRLFFMTFHGKKRWTDDVHPHESPATMVVPMVILAIGSVASGFLLLRNDAIDHWLEPVVGYTKPDPPISIPVITAMTLTVVVIGALIAWAMYLRRDVPETAPARVGVLTTAARRDLYGDAINEAVFMRPGQWLTRSLVWFDNRIIDGAVGGTAAVFGGLSARARRVQTGYARSYALSMLLGVVLVVALLALVRL
jgi:NADH-quinone oxidoreductase subunit L